MNRTLILVIIVAVGLVAYALDSTTFEETVPTHGAVLEARPQEVPEENVPELQPNEPGNIEAGDGVEALEAPEPLPFKMSNGAEKVLKEKLKEEKDMVESRRKWIEETEAEINKLNELLANVPKESKLYKEFSDDLEGKVHYLKSQRKRLAKGEEEVRMIEHILGGK